MNKVDPERALLGALVYLGNKVDEVALIVQPDDLGDPKHRIWYEAMLRVHGQAQFIDVDSLISVLTPERLAQAGGEVYLKQMAADCAFPYSYQNYAEAVSQNAKRRLLTDLGREITSEVNRLDPDELADRMTARLDMMRNRGGAHTLLSFERISQANQQRFEDAMQNPQSILGLSSGLFKLDRGTRGFQGGKTYVVLANTSMGKSTALASFAANMTVPGLIISTESTPYTWLDMVVACMSHVSTDKIQTGDVTNDQASRVIDAYQTIKRRQCHMIDLASPTPELVGAYFRAGMRLYDYQYLMIDSVSNMSATGMSQVYDIISHISHYLQGLARTTLRPIIMSCQAKPEVQKRENKIPQIGDTVGGGPLAYDADTVLSLYRHQYYVESGVEDPDPKYPDNTALFVFAKNRGGNARSLFADVSFIPGMGLYNLGGSH